ncbi:MAG: glycosyltransferase [Bacteroidota bacterium]|nr:glycosyltransferase [Bacteroidota bacterium]
MNLAPIVLFVYNRPWHTQQALESLIKNDLAADSVLYIFADGPNENILDEKINETRKFIKSRQWCKEVIIIEKEKNYGLAESVISGVTKVLNEYGKIIVLEDDIIVSPYFLQYMNDGLNVYENEPKVISIHGYNYPVDSTGLPDTFFMKGADCWGWATWRDRWELLEKDAEKLWREIVSRNLQGEFDIQSSHPYTKMLKDQADNKIDSWAIRWYASAFLNNKYTLYPKESIVFNIGFDSSGTHKASTDHFNNKNWNNKKPVKIEPQKIATNPVALKRWKDYLTDLNNGKKAKRNLLTRYHSRARKIYAKIKGEIKPLK